MDGRRCEWTDGGVNERGRGETDFLIVRDLCVRLPSERRQYGSENPLESIALRPDA